MNIAVSTAEISSRQAPISSRISEISLVIPCYNESHGVDYLARRLRGTLKQFENLGVELVLVDDGSSDDTYEKLKEAFADFEHVQVLSDGRNRGVMGAILHGVKHASHPIVCSMDSDCTFAPEDISKLLAAMDDQTVMVIGSPYHRGARVLNVPAWRIQVSKSAAWIYRRILKPKLSCYTSCFRAYRRDLVKDVQLRDSGFAGTVELVWALQNSTHRIVDCPTDLNVRQFGESKLRLLPVVRKHLSLIGSITLSRLIGKSG